MPELADMLQVWRTQTPYPTDSDWGFASPFTQGERPYGPDSVLKNHVRLAATAAGITKTIGWHTSTSKPIREPSVQLSVVSPGPDVPRKESGVVTEGSKSERHPTMGCPFF
jgi:hypothetical protein